DNGTTDPEARRIFEQHPVDVVPLDEPFNFSRLNNVGVAHADGELVVFLNNDTEVQTPEWLEAMVSLAERDGVGAVGPLLLYPDGTVQHAGVVLGLRGTADHIMRGFRSPDDGYAGSLSCPRGLGAGCAVGGPGDPATIGLIGAPRFQALDFRDARKGALRFPDGGPPSLVHAWTPREGVRELTEEVGSRYGCPYVVHLEDNEDVL